MASAAVRQRKSRDRSKLVERHGQAIPANDILVTVNDDGVARVWHWRDGRWRLEGRVVQG